jgi:hypothetical protein
VARSGKQGVSEIVGRSVLLQRQGFEDLEAVLAKGHRTGRAEGLREAVRSLCQVLSIPLAADRDAQLAGMDAAAHDALRERIVRDRRWS